jgi:outer membrane protein OmpA-like peptidoglycan-associated protein
VSAPAAEAVRAEAGEAWQDPADLLEAIRQGSFEERVATEESLEALLPVPDPVEISFEHGARIPDDQVPALRGVAKALETTEALHVEIVGCSDPVGSASINRRVSASRARAVADTLLELGVREHQIGEVVGLGESCEKQQRIVRVTPRLDAVPPSA